MLPELSVREMLLYTAELKCAPVLLLLDNMVSCNMGGSSLSCIPLSTLYHVPIPGHERGCSSSRKMISIRRCVA